VDMVPDLLGQHLDLGVVKFLVRECQPQVQLFSTFAPSCST
jgi:hypothetical protein